MSLLTNQIFWKFFLIYYKNNKEQEVTLCNVFSYSLVLSALFLMDFWFVWKQPQGVHSPLMLTCCYWSVTKRAECSFIHLTQFLLMLISHITKVY